MPRFRKANFIHVQWKRQCIRWALSGIEFTFEPKVCALVSLEIFEKLLCMLDTPFLLDTAHARLIMHHLENLW